ncbi:MAG: hypothetical protein ACE1ZW_06130 [Nitrospirales bacterium]
MPTIQKNQAEDSSKNIGQDVPSPEKTEDENQPSPRFTILRGIPLKTEVESMNRTLRACTCINIGSQGALLDFGEATCPELPVESKLFVIIQLAGETVKLPGIVRHRKGNVLGIFFPIEGDPNFEEERKVFSIILRTLERGIQRRTTR